MSLMHGQDIIGNIAILKFEWGEKLANKKKEALKFLRMHKGVRTVLEKTGKFSGRLRTLKTRFLAGEKNLEALYRENGCEFRINVESCYFSSRLAAERLEIAKLTKKNEDVLVMFGGVAPYAIVIAKLSGAKRIVSVELGRSCNKYAEINVKRNKVAEVVDIVGGDVRKVLPKMREKFDRIVMPSPKLKGSFLDVAFKRIKKNGIIHYYGFYREDEIEKMVNLIFDEASKAKKLIKIVGLKPAGDIGWLRYRYRADIKVLN
jgi:tRNA (guanine37-N1)-methyltransferase